MSASKKGPLFDAGLCRCCGATKRCRLLNVEYEWLGHKEIYSDMFLDCFGLVLSHLDSEEQERLICATCVSRLREATSFRLQVLQCEERLLRSSIQLHNDGEELPGNVKAESSVKKEKQEADIEIEVDHDDGVDHLDCEMDIDVKAEVEPTRKKSVKNRRGRKCVNGRRRKVSKEELVEKNQMLADMEKMYDRLREIQTVDGEVFGGMEPSMLAHLHLATICFCRFLKSILVFSDNQTQYLQKAENKESDKSIRSLHNLTVIVENSYACPFDTSFSDYFCIYCRQKFTEPDKLREHTLTHNPTDFKTVLQNTGLNKKLQIDTYRIDCRLCPENIVDLDNFKQHIVNHGKVMHSVPDDFLKFRLTPNLSCMECGVTFSFFHALKKHMAEHFGTCICDVCGAHYFEERMLVLHQKTHQKVDETFSCKECGKSFKSKYTRYIHTARMHRKEAAYQCNKCDELFFSYMLRYRHMMSVHGEVRMYQCEHCDRAYDSRKSLREHNRRLHLKIMKHQCDLCDKRFYLPCRLREHMSSHTGERNFRCEYCGKSFPRLRGLKVHMQSHSNEKKFKCVLCNASFTQNVNLKNHMKRQHQSLDVDDSFHE
ncbi:uncharacterized protein [Epargyreus clarus]|uniref:uncharacterized protein n=1 Tax=Epargyreus clarus TaxID=520877 RepID=UPI003C2F9E59